MITVPDGDFDAAGVVQIAGVSNYGSNANWDSLNDWSFTQAGTKSNTTSLNPASAYTNLTGTSGNASRFRFSKSSSTESATWQTKAISANILANSTYTAQVYVGNRTDTNLPGGTNEIDILANGNIIAGWKISAPPEGAWAAYSVTFVTDALGTITGVTGVGGGVTTTGTGVHLGEALQIRIVARGTNDTGAAHDFEFDNVSMDVITTPEPATMSVLALGGLAVLLRRRRR